jgi:XRE family transcriptional regulator, regulator of sulfur utilization
VEKYDRNAAICDELARLITEERLRQGLSENRLAALAGISQSLATRVKKNSRNPMLGSLLRIADALKINLGEILASAIRNVEKNGKERGRR